jgi:uncharacterized protein
VKRLIAAIGLALAISATPACAKDAPKPTREAISRVMDKADLLDSATEQALTLKSEALEKKTSDQLVIVTLPSLQGQTIETVGLTLGRRWGVGQKDLDNGVLLVVAPNERQVRIEVGYGLEALLTDERAAAIIREQADLFRKGRNAEAIVLGVDRIDALLRSNTQRPQYRRPDMKKAA